MACFKCDQKDARGFQLCQNAFWSDTLKIQEIDATNVFTRRRTIRKNKTNPAAVTSGQQKNRRPQQQSHTPNAGNLSCQDLSNLKQGMVSIFCAMAIKDQRIVVKGSPDRTRDLIHVDDVVTKLVSCINSDYQSPVDVGTGSEISVAELVEMIKSKCDDLFGFSVTEYYEDGFSEDIFRSRSPSSVETSVLLSSGITNFLRWTHKELIKND